MYSKNCYIYDLEQWESDEFSVLNLYIYMFTLNELFVWIENPVWASTQKKDMTRSVGYFICMMKIFSETTEPFKCKLAWTHRIFFLWSSAKCFFYHRSNIKVSEWLFNTKWAIFQLHCWADNDVCFVLDQNT